MPRLVFPLSDCAAVTHSRSLLFETYILYKDKSDAPNERNASFASIHPKKSIRKKLCHMPTVTPFEKNLRAILFIDMFRKMLISSIRKGMIQGEKATKKNRGERVLSTESETGISAKEKTGVKTLRTLSYSLYFERGERSFFLVLLPTFICFFKNTRF